jgi:MFS family permease
MRTTATSAGRRRLALRLGVAAVLGVAFAIVAARLSDDQAGWHLIVVFVLTTISFLAVGLVIAERRPGNPIGLLVLVLGLSMAAYVALDGWIALEGTGRAWAALGVSLMDGPLFLIVGALFLVFPDGHLPSPRWRALALVAASLAIVVFLGTLLRHGPFTYYRSLSNPLDPPSTMLTEAWDLAYGLLVVCVAVAALSLPARWRRAGTAGRAQLKWVAFAATLVALAMITYGGTTGPSGYSELGDLSVGVTLGLFPIAIGVAVLRYRLYEIDRIISRTIGWAVVTALLVGVFAAGIVAIQALLADFTQGETVAVAGSTLAALLLFQPLRRRIQAAVDHRFDRARYDAKRAIDEFAGRLRTQVDLGALSVEVGRVATETVRPAHASVWLRNATNRGSEDLS